MKKRASGDSNEELLRRYQQADLAAFEAFYARHESLLFNFLLVRLRDRADAEEAFQETFLRLHRAVADFDPQQNALGWTLTIARNVAVDCLRKRRVRGGAHSDPDLIGVGATAAVALEARQTLEHLLMSLDDAERALLRQRLVEGDTYEQVAENSGGTVAATRQKVSRLLRKLRTR